MFAFGFFLTNAVAAMVCHTSGLLLFSSFQESFQKFDSLAPLWTKPPLWVARVWPHVLCGTSCPIGEEPAIYPKLQPRGGQRLILANCAFGLLSGCFRFLSAGFCRLLCGLAASLPASAAPLRIAASRTTTCAENNSAIVSHTLASKNTTCACCP